MSSPSDASVVLATRRSSDVDLMDRALTEPDCPVEDVVRVGSGFLLLRHLHAHETALVVLGLDLQGAEADLLGELGSQTPAVPVILLVDPEDAASVGVPPTRQVVETLVRGELTGVELAGAISAALRVEGPGPPSAGGHRSGGDIEDSDVRDILRTITDGVVLTDGGGEIVYANPAAERMLGLEKGTIVGRVCADPCFDVRTPDGAPVAAEDRPVPRVLSGRKAVQSATYLLGRKDDEDVIVSIRAAPMGGKEGEPAGVVASIRDVTEEHRIREELGTARRLLDGVVESVPDALYAKDREGRYLMINSAGAGLFDMTVDEVVGLTDESLFTAEDAARIRADDRRVMELGRPIRFREQARTHGGQVRYFDVAKAPLRREDGSVAGVVGISRDVTERRKAERALEQSKEKYEKLFQATPLGIAVSTREDGRILDVNEGFEALLGYPREELLDRRAPDLGIWLEEEDRERLAGRIRRGGEARELEARLRRKDGRVIEAEIFGEAIEVEGVPCIITVTRDVTERRRSQRELARSREKLQRYAAYITTARERERRQLARDIHDHLGQLLTVIKLKVSQLAGASRREGEEGPAPEAFREVAQLIDQAVGDVRDLSTSLRPSALDQFGLVDAIRWQAEQFQERFDVEVTVESAAERLSLGEDRDIHVFRVVQEALTNVGRHAGASRATVRMEREEGLLRVRILDDGGGVEPAAAREADSHGLLGMEERAHVLGGTFDLLNRPEGGAEARLEVPCEEGGGP